LLIKFNGGGFCLDEDVEEVNGRRKLKELGRTAAKEKGAHLTKALQEIIRSIPAYTASVERAVPVGWPDLARWVMKGSG
jgi:hypothetical protein